MLIECTYCHGDGRLRFSGDMHTCEKCGGTGRMTENKQQTYHVQVRLKGEFPKGDWIVEWRKIVANSFEESMLIARSQPGVVCVYESSLIHVGVVT